MKILRTIIFSLLISACVTNMQAQEQVIFPAWLQGTWEISTEFGVSYEKWTKISDSLLIGKTYRVFDVDTIVFDTMKLKYQDNKILLEMSANAKRTRVYAGFVLSQPTSELWKFKNPITDSPHIINYWRIDDKRVYVWTQGLHNNDPCMDFTMTKVKNE